jgi:hypothetical protein
VLPLSTSLTSVSFHLSSVLSYILSSLLSPVLSSLLSSLLSSFLFVCLLLHIFVISLVCHQQRFTNFSRCFFMSALHDRIRWIFLFVFAESGVAIFQGGSGYVLQDFSRLEV